MVLKKGELNAEFSLLLILSRFYHTDSRFSIFPLNDVNKLLVEIDFSLFEKKLSQARTWPVVYSNITKYSLNLPEKTHLLIQKRARNIGLQNLTHHRLLMQIRKKFKAKNISCISMKGTLLAEKLMGSIALRHSKDIDLLVPIGLLERASIELESLGFRCSNLDHFGATDFSVLRKMTHHSIFIHEETGFEIELHWQPCDFVDVLYFPEHVWSSEFTLGADSCGLLPNDELLIYLSAHGSIHFWSRLKWLIDIEQLIVQNEWDWSSLLVKSYNYNCQRSLLLTVLLVHRLLALPLPMEIKQQLQKEPLVYSLAGKVIAISFNGDSYSSESPSVRLWLALNARWYRLQLYSRYSLKAKLIAEAAVPRAEDIQVVSLPRKWFFIYYFIRPARVIFDVLVDSTRRLIANK